MSNRASKSKLHWWILGGMLVGLVLGYAANRAYGPDAVTATAVYQAFDGIATIFLKLLKMIVIPLVFFSLISGMIGIGDLTRLGRMGLRTFALYILTSLLAILLGLSLVNLIRPGEGLAISIPTEAATRQVPESFWDVIAEMIPDNVVAAAASFDVLGVIIFSLFFGAFLLTVRGERQRALVNVIEGGSEVMMKMTSFVISLAPVGIAALIARMVASTGAGVLWELRWYVLTVLLALGGHLAITLPLLISTATRRNPYRYLRVISPALITGFSTASSAGTLAVTMDRVERGAGVSNRVASFVLPIGATVNMDGTALYEIVSVLFVAQLHAGIDPSFALSIGQQILIVFLGLTVSIGAAAIPHAGGEGHRPRRQTGRAETALHRSRQVRRLRHLRARVPDPRPGGRARRLAHRDGLAPRRGRRSDPAEDQHRRHDQSECDLLGEEHDPAQRRQYGNGELHDRRSRRRQAAQSRVPDDVADAGGERSRRGGENDAARRELDAVRREQHDDGHHRHGTQEVARVLGQRVVRAATQQRVDAPPDAGEHHQAGADGRATIRFDSCWTCSSSCFASSASLRDFSISCRLLSSACSSGLQANFDRRKSRTRKVAIVQMNSPGSG